MSSATDADRPALGRSKAFWVCFGLGAWGVFTGFALFLLFINEGEHPWAFLGALLLAAGAAFVIESARGLIEGHEIRRSGPQLVSTLLLIALAELFVVAVHSAPHAPAELIGTLSDLFMGDLAARVVPPLVSLIVVGVVWMLVGALISALMMEFVTEPGEQGRKRIAVGALRGALTGVVIAPVALLGSVLVLRLIGSVYLMIAHHTAWIEHLRAIQLHHVLLMALVQPVVWLDHLWMEVWWGKWVVIAVLGFSAFTIGRKDMPVGRWLALAFAAILVAPLLAELGNLMSLLAMGAFVWGIPAAAIGAFAPLLRQPSRDTRTWGFVAAAGALILVGITILRLGSSWWLLPAGVLAATALLMQRRKAEEWWPLLALTCGFVVMGATWVVQQATFEGVFERVHRIGGLTPEKRPSPLTDLGALEPYTWDSRPTLDLSGLMRVPAAVLSIEQYAEQRAQLAATARDGDTLSFWAEVTALDTLGAERLEATRRLLRTAEQEAKAHVDAADVLHSSPAAKRQVFFSHAANILRTEVAALEGAQRLAAPVWPDSQEGLAALHDLARQGQATWTIEAARSFAARQLPALIERLRVTELVELARVEVPAGAGLADHVRALAAIRAVPWRVQREKAETQFAAISRRRAELEQAEYVRLRERVPHVEHAPALERVRETDTLVREIDAVRPLFADGIGAQRVDELRLAMTARRAYWNAQNKRNAVRLLELTICGSLGFWVSVGLLGGWSIMGRRDDPCDPDRD